MKNLFLMLISALALVACKKSDSKLTADSTVKEVAKEMANMNSYIIEYKQEMNVQGMKTSSVMTQYIDIENDKFAMETETSSDIMGTKTNEKSLTINDKEYTYIINPTQKTGMKLKSDEAEENPMDLIKSQEDQTFKLMIEKEGGKVVGNETFLGKNCIVVEMNKEGQSMKMWYYKGVPLKMTNPVFTLEATKFEENVSIPSSNFEVPKDIKFSELPAMPKMN